MSQVELKGCQETREEDTLNTDYIPKNIKLFAEALLKEDDPNQMLSAVELFLKVCANHNHY